MSKSNVAEKQTAARTHEGAVAARIDAEKQLRRSVMACMLWEDEFYESGEKIADRITSLVSSLSFEEVADIAIEAREKMKLRHAPLFLTVALIKARQGKKKDEALHSGRQIGDLIERVCQRADEPGELLSLYWQGQKDAPLTKQMKIGLARALRKFDEHQLAKYNSDSAAVKPRDVLFLSHAKPADGREGYDKAARKDKKRVVLKKGEKLYKRLAENELKTPDTWEVELSGGADKKATFERLMKEKTLGSLAFLRNLRNMQQAGVSSQLVGDYGAEVDLSRVLPFRFVAAARAVPVWENIVEKMMFRALDGMKKLRGKTAIVVDDSGSMHGAKISAKSDLDRGDAAAALAILLRELCDECVVIAYGTSAELLPPRRGFALRDLIKKGRGGTDTGQAVRLANAQGYDRIIVVTDEQSHTVVGAPQGIGYFINVASAKNGIGYGPWVHIDGWSEAVIDYVRENERK